VSTSHFRPSPERAGAPAILEISPRFPLLGGWKFEFTVGWDLELGKWLKTAEGNKKVLAVPFLTGLTGVVVDEAQLIVTLPEGAK
jgi:oligosaccharyltransferase complex subunit alpha (ribophorin I)